MPESPRVFFITGVAGFIGSHLASFLAARGDHVTGMDNLSTGALSNIETLIAQGRLDFRNNDGGDRALLHHLVNGADVVVHLAAAVGVQKIIDEPVRTLETNIDLTQEILRACVPGRKRLLIASSSEVYGRSTSGLFGEEDDLVIGPPSSRRWGYAASKLVDEFLALAHHFESQLPVTVMRLFNTVGPRQTGRYGMVIPRFVEAALAGKPLAVYGDGSQRRTFTDVGQVTEAITALVDCEASVGRIVNVGGTAETSILDLARRIIELTGSSSSIQLIPYREAYGEHFEDMQRRNPDTRLLQELTGKAPDRPLDEILQAVIDHARTIKTGGRAE